MKSIPCPFRTLALSFLVGACGSDVLLSVSSADQDSIFVQAVDGRLVTGLPANAGDSFDVQRVFSSQFPSTFAWNNPGFHSLALPPLDLEAIPEGTDVAFDFLPMSVDGLVSNLLYWDGVRTEADDVQFGPPPGDGYTMTLFGRNNEPGAVAASDEMVAGPVLGRTETGPGLRMHEHRFFFLDDGSDVSDPEEGVYMVAMQLRMEEFRATEPFFLLWGTLDTPRAALESVARPWVESRVEQLVRDGDFNFDGVVDVADFDVWSSQSGYAGPFPFEGSYADGNRDGVVNDADLAIWEANFACDPSRISLPGDVDFDNDVDTADRNRLVTNWTGALPGGPSRLCWNDGDFDGDGDVDTADQTQLITNWTGAIANVQVSNLAVPEPKHLTVVGMIGAVIILRHRSQRTRQLQEEQSWSPQET